MPDDVWETPPAGEQRCDFCLSPDPVRTFPATTFTIPGSGFVSEDDWMACPPCATDVVNDNREALVERYIESVKVLVVELGGNPAEDDESVSRDIARKVIDGFFEHRILVEC